MHFKFDILDFAIHLLMAENDWNVEKCGDFEAWMERSDWIRIDAPRH